MVIPIFAVERTPELITDLLELQRTRQTRSVPIFLDSPLAIRVTSVFQEHTDELEDLEGKNQLLANSSMHPTASPDESKMLNTISGGAIILSASGMCDAGRIRHHLRQRLWKRNTTVLFVGYQAPGTLGRLLVDTRSHLFLDLLEPQQSGTRDRSATSRAYEISTPLVKEMIAGSEQTSHPACNQLRDIVLLF
jgi:metallo-beta-lactamase family protein